MSTYQTYDFVKDVNFHIKNKNPIDLKNKSEIFKSYLFKMPLFQLNDRIKRNHPLFKEEYFLFILFNTVYIAKKIENEPLTFDYVEIINGLKIIRKMKLKKLFK
jgi:hypothetical protein